jgi:hypothetical protein
MPVVSAGIFILPVALPEIFMPAGRNMPQGINVASLLKQGWLPV